MYKVNVYYWIDKYLHIVYLENSIKMNNTLLTHPTPLVRSELDINSYGSSLSFEVSRTRTQSLPSIRLRNVRQSSWVLEYIYKITDVVLILCGIVFVLSSIAYTSLWMYATFHYKAMGSTSKFDISIPTLPNYEDLGPDKNV